MAETLFKALIYEEGFKDIKVFSACLSAFTGDKSSPNAILVMNEMGLDLSNHRARSLEPSLINEADIIANMTQRHGRRLLPYIPKLLIKPMCSRIHTRSGISPRIGPERSIVISYWIKKKVFRGAPKGITSH